VRFRFNILELGMVGNVMRLPATDASLFDMIDEIRAKVNGVAQSARFQAK
jgi:hypothetical protein